MDSLNIPNLGSTTLAENGSERSWASAVWPLQTSDFSSLREKQGILDIDTEIANGVLDLRVSEQDLIARILPVAR